MRLGKSYRNENSLDGLHPWEHPRIAGRERVGLGMGRADGKQRFTRTCWDLGISWPASPILSLEDPSPSSALLLVTLVLSFLVFSPFDRCRNTHPQFTESSFAAG